MNKLMTAKEANSLSGENNQEVSVNESMKWLSENIMDSCLSGEYEVVTDMNNWHSLTKGNGFIIIPRLERLGYTIEDYYVEAINNGRDITVKKIRISW